MSNNPEEDSIFILDRVVEAMVDKTLAEYNLTRKEEYVIRKEIHTVYCSHCEQIHEGSCSNKARDIVKKRRSKGHQKPWH